eukprot:1140045-Pelagomonas_calceolata.AAC.1
MQTSLIHRLKRPCRACFQEDLGNELNKGTRCLSLLTTTGSVGLLGIEQRSIRRSFNETISTAAGARAQQPVKNAMFIHRYDARRKANRAAKASG